MWFQGKYNISEGMQTEIVSLHLQSTLALVTGPNIEPRGPKATIFLYQQLSSCFTR